MKSRVNLYLPEYQPKLELLTLGALLFLFAALLAIIIATRVALNIQGANTEQQLSRLESEALQQTEFVGVLTGQLEQRKEDPRLLLIFEDLQKAFKDKERLKQALKKREALKTTSFSLMLRELSQQHDEGLWLTRISVDEESMVFDGEVIEPQAVPQWVGRLGQTDYFSGKSFDQARVFRTDSAMFFSLETSRANQEPSSQGGIH